MAILSRNRISLLVVVTAIAFGLSARAEDFYIAQTARGADTGLDAANAHAISFFNASSNWNSPVKIAGTIGPGDTVHLVGTLVTALIVQASGTPGNVITILFEPGAKMTSPAWANSGAIQIQNKSYVTIDGGATGVIGGIAGSAAFVNGIIENTDNGTGLGNQVDSIGISATEAKFFTVKNIAIYNMYVRTRGGEQNSFGAGVVNVDSNSNGISNFLVTNCLIHDAGVGVSSDYGPGDNTYEFSYITAYNCNWGGRCGDRNVTSTMTGLLVHHNYFYNFTNWDDTAVTNSHHHNGFYAWAESGGTLHSATFYANVIGPNYSIVNPTDPSQANHSTSGLFFSGAGFVGPLLVYDNLFLENTFDAPSNGLITIGAGNGLLARVYNNTFIGGGSGTAITVGGNNGGVQLVDIKNNIATGKTFISVTNNAAIVLTSDYNDGYNLLSGQEFTTSVNSTSSFQTLAQWQLLGFDAHSISGNPLFVGATDFHLALASPSIDAGVDLSGFFTTDQDGVARPQGPAWDIGAYENTPPAVPVVVANPVSQIVAPGSNVTFTALARGAATLTVKWQKNAVDLVDGGTVSGATTGTLSLTGVTSADNGNYRLVATNGSGSDTSTAALLTVSDAAFVTLQPVGQVVTAGGTAVFTSAAIGTPAPTFQWKKNGTNLSNGGNVSGANGNTLTLTNVSAADAATYTVFVNNINGSDTSTGAVLTVNNVPSFTTNPAAQVASTGDTVAFTVAAIGTPAPSFQWQRNGVTLSDGGIVSGSATATLTLTGVSPSDSATYRAVATNAAGSVNSLGAALVVSNPVPTTAAPTVTSPVSQTVTSGGVTSFTVVVGGVPTPTIQWYRNGSAIAGATSATLTLSGVTSANAGSYVAVATNSQGTATSNSAVLTVLVPSRIVNFSARAVPGVGSDTVIAGFIVSGGTKSVLIRAVGPTLTRFNLSGVLADPQLNLFDGPLPFQSNDNWGGSNILSEAFAKVGAFPFPTNSLDSALLLNLSPDPYSAQVIGAGGAGGITLVEIYDSDLTDTPAGRIVNVSARAQVGSGNNVLIAGFIISGSSPMRVLIRAVGPGLTRYNLTNAIPDPQVALYKDSTLLTQNDDWGGTTILANAFAQVGAFPLSSPTSKDAALIATLQPGLYTAQVSGVNGSSGVALVEIYELP